MINIKKLKDLSPKELSTLYNRFGDDFSSVLIDTVIPIVKEVKAHGDSAVIKYTEKYDGIKLGALMAADDEIDSGWRNTPKESLNAFLEAKKNIWDFHSRQKRENLTIKKDGDITLGVIYQPIENGAVYVPGGKASYPSSVLMGLIPAIIAGTKNITLITPPGKNGRVPDIILALCRELNVKRIIKSGGAQGIAAAGLGTESVDKSDIIVGPGNIYVTAAKTYLFSLGLIQIDSLAGPSEVLIIADEKSDPRWVAYDLLSQAEHEEMAKAILLTPSESLAEKVRDEINHDLKKKTGRHEIKNRSISSGGLILITGGIEEAIDFSNLYAPEHMELHVDDPMKYLEKIKNVGSLFLGRFAPVSIGDYYSGTNHILPTGGAARFSSGTSVETFMRRTTFQHPTRKFLERARGPVNIMSGIEGFQDMHGGSIAVRLEDKSFIDGGRNADPG